MKNLLVILILTFSLAMYGQQSPFGDEGPYETSSPKQATEEPLNNFGESDKEVFQTPIDQWILLLILAGAATGYYYLNREKNNVVE